MKPRILVVGFTMSVLAAGAGATDSQLLKLVMPDVKVMSDVNVATAKSTLFGQFVLSQLPTADVSKLIALTGFDPAQDLNELLCASNGSQGSQLALATGLFDPNKPANLAKQDGAVTELYGPVMIYENPAKTGGVAFLNSGLRAAGDIADVKAAIDRQTAPTTLPKSLTDEIAMLSN